MFSYKEYVYQKSSIKPPGAHLISDLPERGLDREGSFTRQGAYSQNQVTRIYLVAFQFFYPIFYRINTQSYGSKK